VKREVSGVKWGEKRDGCLVYEMEKEEMKEETGSFCMLSNRKRGEE
jgi:hypothetical protein